MVEFDERMNLKKLFELNFLRFDKGNFKKKILKKPPGKGGRAVLGEKTSDDLSMLLKKHFTTIYRKFFLKIEFNILFTTVFVGGNTINKNFSFYCEHFR